MRTPSRQCAVFGALAAGLISLISCEFDEYQYAFPQPTIIDVRDVSQEEFTLEWAEVYDAEQYLVEVSTDSSFSTEVGVSQFPTSRTDQRIRGERITPFAMYYCRVSTAFENESDSNYSQVVEVQLSPLDPPEPGIPDGLPPGLRAVRWESVRLAEKFEVQVSLAPVFDDSTLILFDDETEELAYGWAPESFFDEYYVRVRSVNGDNFSVWSDTVYIPTNSDATCILQEILTDSSEYRFKLEGGGQGGDPFIEEIELFTLEGPDQERILRQRAFLTYSGEFLAYADVEDTFLGEMYWDFVYTPSGKLEFFALYDSIDDIVAGQYFYTEDGLVESVGIINYQPGPVDTVYISFEYNDVGDVVKQIGPGEVELTFTYTDDVVNPNFWLPEAVQLMVQNSPEMALLGIDYSYRSFLSVVPKNKAIASVTDQEGNIITYENFSESGQLNAAQSVNGLIDYEFGRCGF